MEGNRDEAEKCIGIAREALEAGNRDRALRFLGKAQKLYPTETARGEARPPPLCPAPPRPCCRCCPSSPPAWPLLSFPRLRGPWGLGQCGQGESPYSGAG